MSFLRESPAGDGTLLDYSMPRARRIEARNSAHDTPPFVLSPPLPPDDVAGTNPSCSMHEDLERRAFHDHDLDPCLIPCSSRF